MKIATSNSLDIFKYSPFWKITRLHVRVEVSTKVHLYGCSHVLFVNPLRKPCHTDYADNKKNHQEAGKLIKYFEVVSYLLELYGSDDVIAGAEAENFSFIQPT